MTASKSVAAVSRRINQAKDYGDILKVFGEIFGDDQILESAHKREKKTDNLFWGKEAMRWVLARRKNYFKAVQRKDIGGDGHIAFMWGMAGKEPGFSGEGIANIIARQNWERKQLSGQGPTGEELAYRLVEILSRGRIKRKYGTPRDKKIDITYQGNIATIQWMNTRKLWFLNGYRAESQGLAQILESAKQPRTKPEIRKFLESIDPKEVKALKRKSVREYRQVLKSIVRKLFPKGADLRFRKDGRDYDYYHFIKDRGRRRYIHTLPDTLKREHVKIGLKDDDKDKEYFIKKYFDKEIQKDIWDVIVIHDGEIRTKFARRGRKGEATVEKLIGGAGNGASRSAASDGVLENASTHTENHFIEDRLHHTDTLVNHVIEDVDLSEKGHKKSVMGGRAVPPSGHDSRQAARFSDLHDGKDKISTITESVNQKSLFGDMLFESAVKFKEKKFKLQDRYTFQGIPVSIETKKGQTRKGVDPDGHEWSIKMKFDYGYIRSTRGEDDEGVDVYVGPDRKAAHAYIVKQHKIKAVKEWGSETCPKCKEHVHDCACAEFYDEDKVMLGFTNRKAAIDAYLKQYDSPLFLGPVSTMILEDFKKLISQPKKKTEIPLQFVTESAAVIKSMAKKADLSVEEAEERWKKAKEITKEQKPGLEEGSDEYYAYVMGVFKKSMGITEKKGN